MKKSIYCISCLVSIFIFFSTSGNSYAGMANYCAVPPYVIQDVPPNIMMVIDNSGSMFNFAYACTTTNVTSSGTNTNVISVKDASGFQPRQWIAVGTTQLEITANGVDTNNNTITVTVPVSFSVGDAVIDYGCYSGNFYDDSYTCASSYAASNQSSNTIAVHNTSNFWVGEIVTVASSVGSYERTITAIPDFTHLTVDSSVTVATNDHVYDYNCYNLGYPYPEQSFDPARSYYGYFLSTYWYTYDSSGNRFVTSRLKAGTTKASNEWDGNFMNWLTMRRVDVLNKVMTGGKTTTQNRLVTRRADYDGRGLHKAVFSAQNYMGCTGCTGNVNVTFSTGASNPSSFTAYSGPAAPGSWTSRGSYNLYVVVPAAMVPVGGVLQNVVGTRARLGLTFYNTNQGGYVQVPVAASNLSSAVNQINNMTPNANTPLAETLWTVGGYFAQQASITSIGSPGPMYKSGDYQTNSNNDPLNYGTGGNPRWPDCSTSYVLLVTDGEPCSDGDLPSAFGTYASANTSFLCSGSHCPAYPAGCTEGVNCLFNSEDIPSCPAGSNVVGLESVALYLHTHDLRNQGGTPDIGTDNLSGEQNLTLYTVYAFGKNSTLLKYAAINGGFHDLNGNNKPDLQAEWDTSGNGVPDNYYEADEGSSLETAITSALSSMLSRASSGTAASVLASGEGSGANLVQAIFYPRRRFGNDIVFWTGESQNFWYYVDPFFADSNIREDTHADDILNLQEDYITQFYFDQTKLLTMSRRCQDTNGNGAPDVQITPDIPFESLSALWKAGKTLWSRDLSVDPRTIFTSIDSDTSTPPHLLDFSVGNESTLRPYMNIAGDDVATDIIQYTQGQGLTTLLDADGNTIIAGVDRNGDGVDDYRARYATIGADTHVWKMGDVLDSTPKIASWIPLNNYDTVQLDTSYKKYTSSSEYSGRGMVFAGGNDGMLHAFKLGTLNLKWTGQGKYQIADLTGSNFGKEEWAFIPKNVLPYLQYIADPDYCHVFTVDLSPYIFDASIGDKNSGDISSNTRPTDGSTWRTILIVGMRTGGATRKIGSTTCSSNSNCASGQTCLGTCSGSSISCSSSSDCPTAGQTCQGTCSTCNSASCSITSSQSCDPKNNHCPSGEFCLPNCVNTPLADPSNPSKGLGYSSYFALDITDSLANPDDPVNHPPALLWEFSRDDLGYSTTGPSAVRIGDSSTNGKWYVVVGSGPTGPIESSDTQFLGRSDQNLKFFVLDLKTGALKETIDTGIQNAFAGSMFNATIDVDPPAFPAPLSPYQDDAIYVGYTKKASDNTWTDGGVGRIQTLDKDPSVTPWGWSKLIDGIGSVTSAVARLENPKKDPPELWLYFGTGRYFYEIQNNADDETGMQQLSGSKYGFELFGIKDPCFTSAASFESTLCSSSVSRGSLTDRTSLSSCPSNTDCPEPAVGWFINLDTTGNYSYCGQYTVNNCTGGGVCAQSPIPSQGFYAERVITDPVTTTTGLAFFTTYKPYSDECGIGGKSFIWATRYNSGSAPDASLLKGVALLQVSTGSIEQKQLSSAFTDAGNRKSGAMEGVPPTEQGLSLLSPPPPVKRILHMKER